LLEGIVIASILNYFFEFLEADPAIRYYLLLFSKAKG